MHTYDERKDVRDAMNRSLDSLRGNSFLVQRILINAKGESRRMKRKLSVGRAIAVAAMLVAVTALAIGLVFSPQYSEKRLADRALNEQYGITDEMMMVLFRGGAENAPDGNRVFTYAALEELYAEQIGVYTVTVKDGKAYAVWSHDGEDTSGGIEANA